MNVVNVFVNARQNVDFVYITCTGWAKLNGANFHFCL